MDDDRISLKEASTISGRSERTLRRWLKEGHIQDLRAQGDTASPIQVSESKLKEYLATLTPPLPDKARHVNEAMEGEPRPVMSSHDPVLVQALQGQVQALQGQVQAFQSLVATVEGT